MAIRTAQFKAGVVGLKGLVALSCSGFLAIVSIAKNRETESEKKRPMIDQQIEIPTKDGHTTTFITHPERGGPFPVIIFYMDAPAIREELRDMARRLAHLGLLRDAAQPVLPLRRHGAWADPARPGSARTQAHVRVHELDQHSPGDGGHQRPARLCRQATRRAQRHCRHRRLLHERAICRQRGDAFPGRVKAAASIYGTHLATDQPDSPHLAGQKTKAELYFGCAETDIYAPQEIIEKVKQGMKDNGANAEVEIYPGTHHGFAFPKRPVYHRDAAERHWERLLALYRRNLSS